METVTDKEPPSYMFFARNSFDARHRPVNSRKYSE